MANYSAVIDLRVNGVESLKIAKDTLASIDRITKFIKPVPSLFDQRGTEEAKKAKTELAGLIKSYADGNTVSAKFATTLAGINSQLQTFKNVAANSKVGSDEFVNSLKAGEIASQRLLKAELERLTTLKGMYTRQATGTLSAADQGPTKLVRDLLDVRKEVPKSIAGLKSYASELQYVFELIESGTPEFNLLQKAIASVNKELDIAMGQGALQGPKLPTGFTEAGPIKGRGPSLPLTAKPKTGLKQPGVLDAILGGGFPLLFGGGPGAVFGGAAGGFLGGAMGGMAGMALSVGLSAVGQILDDTVKKFGEIQTAANNLNVDGLRDSVLTVNSALDVQVNTLIRVGELDAARAAIAKEVEKQTGVGAGTQEDVLNVTLMLKNAFDSVAGAVGGTLSILAGPLLVGVSLILEGVAQIFRWINQWYTAAYKFIKQIPGIGKLTEVFKATDEELENANAQVQLLLDKTYDEILAKQKILDLEKQRTLGRTAEEKAINALIDKEQKIAQIRTDTEEKIKDIRVQNKKAEEERVNQLVRAEEIKRDQLIEEIEIADKLQEQLRIQEAINEAATIRTKQLELAKMQEEIAIRIAQLNNTLTQQEAERLITANELLLVQRQINNEQSRLAQLEPLLTDEQILDAKTKIAGLQLQEVNLKLKLEDQEVERIKEQIARFKDVKIVVTINNEKFLTSLKTASEVIQSTTNLFNAQFAAQKAINDLLIQRAEQEGDLDKAYALRVKQVELTYRQTVLQIQVEVEQARIKLYQVRLEHQKLALQMQQISLVRKLTGTEVDTLKQSKEMLKLMEYQLALVIKAAGYRFQEAEAIRKMTLEQLAFNRAKEQGERGSEDRTITQEGIVSRFPSPSRFFAAGGYVDKPTVGLIGEGNEGEFVIPESKMAAAMDRYAAGRRGEATIPVDSEGSFGQGSSTSALGANMPRISNQINVTTGPVMQLDGKTYVSQQDMAQSLRSTADTAVRATLKMLQYNTQVRKSIGIA